MSETRQEIEHTQPALPVCIGIALKGEKIQVAARAGGLEVGQGLFPADAIGQAVLLSYLVDCQTPLRLAVAAAGTAALGLALSLGSLQGREVFLVASRTDGVASDLACYAERAI